MPTNCRFSVGMHILAVLASHPGEPVTSAYIAGSVNTNPVVIRRLLSALRRARLVEATKGSAGGFALARRSEDITLLEVYRTVEPVEPLAFPESEPNAKCPIGAKIQSALAGVFLTAQAAMEKELARVTLADIVQRISPGRARSA